VTGGKPIAVLLQSISGAYLPMLATINPLVTFYDIHGGKGEVLFFYFVSYTTRDVQNIYYYYFGHPSDDLCELCLIQVQGESNIHGAKACPDVTYYRSVEMEPKPTSRNATNFPN
jgi:hypothetical protein